MKENTCWSKLIITQDRYTCDTASVGSQTLFIATNMLDKDTYLSNRNAATEWSYSLEISWKFQREFPRLTEMAIFKPARRPLACTVDLCLVFFAVHNRPRNAQKNTDNIREVVPIFWWKYFQVLHDQFEALSFKNLNVLTVLIGFPITK